MVPPCGLLVARSARYPEGQGRELLRIELEPSDLLAVRIESRPGPLDDVSGAGRALRRRASPLLLGWRETVLPRLRPAASLALLLQPPRGFSFDFTSPVAGCLDEGLEKVLATPKRVLRFETGEYAADHGPPPSVLRNLIDGDSATLQRVATSLRSLHDAAVAPYAARLQLIREADAARRTTILAREGVASMLNTIHASMRLRGLVLELDRPFYRSVRSPGQGIVLRPSPWLHDEVRLEYAPDAAMTVVYPVRLPLSGPLAAPTDGAGAEGPLARLLGGTRAGLVAAVAASDGTNTLALAHRLGISASTASEHVGVLRAAGLVTTVRGRGGAVHRLTPLGEQLLGSNL